MMRRQPEIVRHARDQPDDVALVQVSSRRIVRAADRLEKRHVHSDGELGSPTPQRGRLDLQLRHQPFGARGPPVGPADGGRRRRACAGMVEQHLEIRLHPVPGEIDGLDLEAEPRGRGGVAGNHKVNAAGGAARRRGPHERNLAGDEDVIEADDLPEPSRDQVVFLEPVRACDDGPRFAGPDGADAAPLAASRTPALKRAGRRLLPPERRPRQRLPAGGGHADERFPEPFGDAVAVGHAKSGRGVMTSSGRRLWRVLVIDRRAAWKPWRRTRSAISGAAS